MTARAVGRPTFVVALQAASGRDGIRALRAVLKYAGRYAGMRAVSIKEHHEHPARRWRSTRTVEAKQRPESKTMDMKQYAGSQFLKVKDVKEGPIRATIAAVTLGQYDRPDIVFEDGSKLSANATNTRALNRAFGDQSEDWIGGEVELVLGEVEYQKELKESIIIKPIAPAKPKEGPTKTAKAKPAKPDINDEVAF